MNIPYAIDNVETRQADVLNHLLDSHPGAELDIATAYFSIHGFAQLRDSLRGVSRFRLLLGDEPGECADLGLRPDAAGYLRHEINAEPLRADTARLVEDLLRFLRREDLRLVCYAYICA